MSLDFCNHARQSLLLQSLISGNLQKFSHGSQNYLVQNEHQGEKKTQDHSFDNAALPSVNTEHRNQVPLQLH